MPTLTPEIVKQRIDELIQKYGKGDDGEDDPDRFHQGEDSLSFAFICHVADTCEGDLKYMADMIIELSNYDISRWYS